MVVYVNRESYSVLTISKYNVMRETMIADAINDSNEFEEWLDWNYNISKIFFFTDKEKNEIWEEWVSAKTCDIDEDLECCWYLRELEV
jgi:hypothetical protein